MTFNSLQYAPFLPVVVLLLHWLLPRRFRLPLLLVASYVFYGAWDYRFLSLLLISTLTDYWIGLALGRTDATTLIVLFSGSGSVPFIYFQF